MRRRPPLALDFLLAAFFGATSLYCLLAYIPFTWTNFLRLHPYVLLDFFARAHTGLYFALLAGVAFASRDDLRDPRRRPPVVASLGLAGLAGLMLAARPLSALQNDEASLFWAFGAWVPFLGLEAFLHRGLAPIHWAEEADPAQDRRLFAGAVKAALFITLFFAALAAARSGAGTALAVGAVYSLLAHLLVFLAAFLALQAACAAAALLPRPGRTEFWFCAAALWLGLQVSGERLVLASIPFLGPAARLYAAVAASALTAAWLLTAAERAGAGPSGGLDLLLSPLDAGTPARRWITLAAAAAGALALLLAVSHTDWNFVFQRSTALLLWGVAFALFRAESAPGAGLPAAAWLCIALVLGLQRAAETLQPKVDAALASRGTRVARALEAQAAADSSYALARKILFPAPAGAIYPFLNRHTNISRATPTAPVETKLTAELEPSARWKPDIYVIVIDSLRRDYLSPYDPKVRFTPGIAAFAAESSVFRNSFTRYGATGLSEPSIWVGGAMLHKQYIQPFAPLNALHRMLGIDGYKVAVSREPILNDILDPARPVTDLDEGALHRDLELCGALEGLRARWGGLHGTDPLFVYTQPQDVHISAINRQGRSVVGGPDPAYEGFDAPYASRVRRIDRCFGDFIGFLKAKNAYADSLIILTADHGDSLGEQGRWGHAYTLFPEVVRVPLIVHLPERWKDRAVDLERAALLTDLTPSLYGLLGHGPIARNGLYGRPLFTPTLAEQDAWPKDGDVLLASSYGPVYGLLRQGGRFLYIVDGVNYKTYYYDLKNDPAGTRNLVTPDLEEELNGRVREEIEKVAAYYKFPG